MTQRRVRTESSRLECTGARIHWRERRRCFCWDGLREARLGSCCRSSAGPVGRRAVQHRAQTASARINHTAESRKTETPLRKSLSGRRGLRATLIPRGESDRSPQGSVRAEQARNVGPKERSITGGAAHKPTESATCEGGGRQYTDGEARAREGANSGANSKHGKGVGDG